jgi:hypothetical protein
MSEHSPAEQLFDPNELLAAARAIDGLEDVGDDSYREPLEQLCWSLQHEARLNAIGGPILRQRLLDILATRLRVEEYCRPAQDRHHHVAPHHSCRSSDVGATVVRGALSQSGA